MEKITNYKLQITNKFKILKPKFKKFGISNFGYWRLFVIWCLVLGILLPAVAGAWVITDPIVPCGSLLEEGGQCMETNGAWECYGSGEDANAGNECVTNADCGSQPPCSQCELLHLADNLIDFILIGVAPILATFFFLVAGVYIMLGGAKPDMLATGKRMFSNAFIGIIIVMLAWLMTNTLIISLVKGTIDFSEFGSNMPFNSADWWTLTCDQVGLSTKPPSGDYSQASYGGGGCNNNNDPICISNVQISAQTNNSATLTWTTNIGGNGWVEYGLDNNLETGPVFDPATPGLTTHRVTLNGLQSNTSYCYQVFSAPVGGFFTAQAPVPPGIFTTTGSGGGGGCVATIVITGEQAVPNSTSATITWTTNADASSEIEYRETGNSVWTSRFGSSDATSHSALAVGLLSNRAYEYRVISVGGSGYRAVGSVRTFTTLP